MKYPKKSFKRNLSGYMSYEFKEGELIEEKVARLTQEKSPINDGAPIIYTERKDGVLPAYDIRTDRWEIAQAAMEINQKTTERWKNKKKMPSIRKKLEILLRSRNRRDKPHI